MYNSALYMVENDDKYLVDEYVHAIWGLWGSWHIDGRFLRA